MGSSSHKSDGRSVPGHPTATNTKDRLKTNTTQRKHRPKTRSIDLTFHRPTRNITSPPSLRNKRGENTILPYNILPQPTINLKLCKHPNSAHSLAKRHPTQTSQLLLTTPTPPDRLPRIVQRKSKHNTLKMFCFY
ncbi:MAG TPA: hypothetical protein DCE42_22375 [Myxococcales bacterium]|nr:hypothetical protein [Deltaproteobacteria bacterium]MBU52123.1 hypothetical protein [Deltaproteobacteria bacterium]HAA57529.1 hypothetical protein [Myxococcales bacterium]